MENKKMIFTGEKESFIARVLIAKAKDAGIACEFVPFAVDDLNAAIGDAPFVTLYMEEGVKPAEEVLHFLSDMLDEKNGKLILIGEPDGIRFIYDNMPPDFVYKTFSRPVDNAAFTAAVKEYFAKADAGEFKKSILIVDDDPQYLSLVRQWLKEDYKVSVVNSGLQAIKYLGRNKVDLILLDHEMPVTSGPQVLEMLRSDSETRSIPVIFLTGKSDKESVMQVVALKPEGYFLKSIQRPELLDKLKSFFVLRGTQR